jgi:UDP-N-acetylmuramyl pentapeptide phosphotransferase/UDP-N-acetylglucosamine-1-phosphate transferase
VGILSGNIFALVIVTLLFFAETLSVIIQVLYYKATKGPDGVGSAFFAWLRYTIISSCRAGLSYGWWPPFTASPPL